MISDLENMGKPMQQLLGGFIRMHVLHHAAEERGVLGNWMIEELRHHGYRLSPGTLYPMLHAMEKAGWLKSEETASGGRKRIYRIPPLARRPWPSRGCDPKNCSRKWPQREQRTSLQHPQTYSKPT